MSEEAIGVGLLALVGLLLLLVGWLIAFKQRGNLIAGWNEELLANPRAYMAWFGGAAMVFGIFLLVCAGLVAVDRGRSGASVAIAGGVLFLATVLGAGFKYRR